MAEFFGRSPDVEIKNSALPHILRPLAANAAHLLPYPFYGHFDRTPVPVGAPQNTVQQGEGEYRDY